MVKEGHTGQRLDFVSPGRGLARICAVVVLLTIHPAARGAEAPVRLQDAGQQGTFNVGTATATVQRQADASREGEVLKVECRLPAGTAAGVWSKAFPDRLAVGRMDVVRVGTRVPPEMPAGRFTAAVEIKGTAGTQRIPLTLENEWTEHEARVDWPAIGAVNEVVFLLTPTGAAPAATHAAPDTVLLELRFEPLSPLRRLSTSSLGRMAGVLVASLLATALVVLLRRIVTFWQRVGHGPEVAEAKASLPRAPQGGLVRDFVQGAGLTLIAVLALAVFELGGRSPLEVGWSALGLAVAGGMLAEWWTFGLTGRHLTAREVFQHVLATGLLAAAASPLAILQAPASWSDLLMLSQTVAAAAVLIYHGANAARLATAGKPLRPTTAALIVATPFVVGNLVLLESNHLLEQLGAMVTMHLVPIPLAVLALIGRLVVVFSFNILVANGLSLAVKHAPLTGIRAYAALLAVAAAVVVAPWIAAYGIDLLARFPEPGLQLVIAVLATVLSQAGLWAQGYLITGMVLDALHGQAPTSASTAAHPIQGMKKGIVFSGTFMGLIYGLAAIWAIPSVQQLVREAPLFAALLGGALVFPLIKTIIESFDGSQAFFRRVAQSYRKPILYVRGAVVGLGLGYGLTHNLAARSISERAGFGFAVGVAAYAGIDLLRDVLLSLRGRGRVRSWRVYLVHALLGGCIAAAIGFYLDTVQVQVVVDKYHRYLGSGWTHERYGEYPLLSKWGFIDLGPINGGVSLLFCEALAGVVSWSIPAWLFALNRTFMAAYFRKDTAPLRALVTRDGMNQLTQNMIEVLRWGLWMSPIIKSFLRPMGEPTWYNQDGAIRTLWAIVQDVRLSPAEFRAWSLGVFIALLAYDWVRILIWLDHMGLRVATLVNLSFLGMDRLEARLARFLAPASTARCIPEAVKRFTTWAPLLIPYYIPRGRDWDTAWNQSQAIRNQAPGGPLSSLETLSLSRGLMLVAAAAVGATAVVAVLRRLRLRFVPAGTARWRLGHPGFEVTLHENGELLSRVPARDYDVSRRSYDRLDPAGRALFLVDPARDAGDPARVWPLVGNLRAARRLPASAVGGDGTLRLAQTLHGVRSSVEISLPDPADPVELWTIRLENLANTPRRLKVVPYLEWVLNRPEVDRGHTQYNRLFAELEYVSGLNAVLAWDKHSKALGLLAADVAPEGFLSARVDFIGRARSLAAPRVLETLSFMAAEDTEAHPTFDPIGSLLLGVSLASRGSYQLHLLVGLCGTKAEAIDLVARHLGIAGAAAVDPGRRRKARHSIGHGEIPPGTPQPYSELTDDGRRLLVHTPFSPRPIDHTLSNRLGHIVSVTNRGLHTTASVNAQQNRLTPDWPDTVTRELPGEAYYLYDIDRHQWYSPTYHPLNDPEASHDVEFGLDGTARFVMRRDDLETELTVFVPPDEPVGVHRLRVRNEASTLRRLRLAAYFQMVLGDQPEHSGRLAITVDHDRGAVFFRNPRNDFRTGPAFVAMSHPVEQVETVRGRFFGPAGDSARPLLLEGGPPAEGPVADDRPVAALLTTLEIPAHGEATVVVVLGQAGTEAVASQVIARYRDPAAARGRLEDTRRWWLGLLETVTVQTSQSEFDRYLNWLKYQALAERIWARRGFYQSSGAYGYRDQLQDAVNLIWMDPALARRQILLHASQQFLEGDVVHWFHLLQDGRTGFAARTHASDNLLWLPWAVVEYVAATGDQSLLQERTAYLEAEQPFEPLPKGKHGMGFDPLRSAREDTIYRHCLRAIDLVLDRKMGAHGLPLIGTGDWNDGLDEIGSQGKGESIWLGLFLLYILDRMTGISERQEGPARRQHYDARAQALRAAVEQTWRGDRYLRAIHDDGTEIGVAGSGVWEIDALTAAWAVLAGVNPERGRIVFDTAVSILEKETTILLGWPPLREDTKPYLGRSSGYPEGVRENGMYCHGDQWLVGAARVLADRFERAGQTDEARHYRETAYRLWLKISAIPHVLPEEIETYGGQPNKQAADMVTTFDPGRMIWHGYTGAAGWMFRQALEGVLGFRLDRGRLVPPPAPACATEPVALRVARDLSRSPIDAPPQLRTPAQRFDAAESESTLPT